MFINNLRTAALKLAALRAAASSTVSNNSDTVLAAKVAAGAVIAGTGVLYGNKELNRYVDETNLIKEEDFYKANTAQRAENSRLNMKCADEPTTSLVDILFNARKCGKQWKMNETDRNKRFEENKAEFLAKLKEEAGSKRSVR